MTFYRCPVLPLAGEKPIPVRDPLACIDFDAAGNRIGNACDKKFKSLGAGVKYRCPNLNKGCVMGAFLYPRKKRAEGGFHYHQGIDIGNTTGQPIVAVVAGEVVALHKEDDNNGYGRSVVIKGRHRGKDLYTLYGHCHEIFINLGERVAEQKKIATVGYSGNAGILAPHLHFECSNTKLPTKLGVETVLGQTEGPFPRTDPHRLLAELGPWGSTEVFFPDSPKLRVTHGETETRHSQVERSDRGGYFPLGSNSTWHGGVHLQWAVGEPIFAPFDAEIVALRLDPNPATALGAYGHTNFILLRHEISDEAFRRLQWRPNTPGTPDDEADAAEVHAGKTFKNFVVGYPTQGPVTESAPEHVDWVRHRLHRIREYGLALATGAPEIPAVSITGPYDEALRAAIIKFQQGYVPYFEVRPGKEPPVAEGYVTAKGDTRKRLAKTCPQLFGTKKKQPKGTPPPTPEAATVGHEGTNSPEDVIRAKHALHNAVTPGKFYAPSDPAVLDDPTVDEALIAAIEAFQRFMGYPFKKKGLLWPDGVMTVGAKTWTALFAAQPPAPPPEPGSDPPPAEEPVKLDPKRTIYSLLMHLNALPIDAAAAKRFPWLTEVQLPATLEEEQDVAVQRALKRAGDDAERSRGIAADVGAPGVASDPADVEWVRQRLVRFGYSSAAVSGVYDDELRGAIAEFQRKHVKYYSPTAKKPQEAPGYVRVGVVSKSGKISKADTHKQLKESYASLFGQTKPPVDPVFALRAATVSPGTGATIITRPGVFIGAGQPLWASGIAQGRGMALYPQFHWELFSAHPMIEPWEQLEDIDEDLTVDVPGKVFDRIEYDGPPGFSKDNILHPEEVLDFYRSDKAAFFRQMQCRFRSEWGLDIATSVTRLQAQGFITTGYAEQIRPYLWWDEAKSGAGDAMPDSKHVWHYNPIEFLWRYEQVLATMRPKEDPTPTVSGSVEVIVSYADYSPMHDALVHLALGENVVGSRLTDLEGVAQFAGVAAGKGAVWVDQTAVEAVFELKPGEHRVISLRTTLPAPDVVLGGLLVTVLGTDAMPVPGALVRLTRHYVDVDASVTDAEGNASFSLAQGYYIAHAAGTDSAPVTVIAGNVTEQVLQFVMVGMVAVQLRDSKGVRVAAQGIGLSEVGGSPLARAATDADGHCVFELIPEGEYEVYVEDTPAVSQLIAVVQDAMASANLVVPLPDVPNHTEVLGAIDVLVVGPGRLPSQGDTVYLLDDVGERLDDATADADGLASFDDLEPGVYGISSDFAVSDQLGLAVDAGTRKSLVLEVGARDAPKPTPDNGRGTLVVAAWLVPSGTPACGLWVKVSQNGELVRTLMLGQDGTIRFEDVDAGPCRVFIDGMEADGVNFELLAGQTAPVMLPIPEAV